MLDPPVGTAWRTAYTPANDVDTAGCAALASPCFQQVGVTIRAWRRPQVDIQPQTELARSVVSEIAPSELPLFEIMSRSFAANPRRVRIRRGGDEELGFGIAESAMLVTPVALAAIREIALFLAHAAADAVAARITRLFRRDSGTPPLTDTQLQASATLWSKLHNLLSWVRRRQPCWSIRWSPT
jgi:hypothetical protein